jgi:arylformamidase
MLIFAATILVSSSVMGAELEIHRDLSYARTAEARQRLDVYTRADGNNRPVLVWIHGGGWRRGDKSNVQHKPRAFVDQGFVFVSLNYRFVPQITVREMAGDIAKAIKWVHDNAEQYGGAPDLIFVAGHSAGAHLAALVCTDESYLEAEGLRLSAIKGCIPVDSAMYDISSQLKNVGPLRMGIYTTAFGRSEAGHTGLSPITHVAQGKDIPPFLILYVADRPDAASQSRVFAKALADAGVSAKTVVGEGKTHATINRDLGLPGDEPTKAVFAFLRGLLEDR